MILPEDGGYTVYEELDGNLFRLYHGKTLLKVQGWTAENCI
jgi:hypothetical protein